MKISDNKITFHPDYVPRKKLAAVLLGLGLFAVALLVILLGFRPLASMPFDERIMMIGLAVSIVLFLVGMMLRLLTQNHTNKDLYFVANQDGVAVWYQDRLYQQIPWYRIWDIVDSIGPCEPESWYGVYIFGFGAYGLNPNPSDY